MIRPTQAAKGALPLVGLCGVVALSLLLRATNLLTLPIFTDEAIYLHWANEIWQQRTREALLIPIADDGKQPLFMWLAGGVISLIGDPLLAGRLVSVAAGVAGTVGMYLGGRWLRGNSTGLVAALLYAVTPFTLLFDRMALVDGLLTATAVWALSLGIYLATRVRTGRGALLPGIALGAVLGGAIWTKMTALFLLPFPLLCLLLVRKREDAHAPAVGLGLAYGISAVLALALALMPNAGNLVSKTGSFSVPLSELRALPLDLWATNALSYWSWIVHYLPAPLWWLMLPASLWALAARRRHALLLLGCWAAFTLPPMLTGRLLYTTRYVVPGVAPLLLLTADSATASWSWVRALPGSPLKRRGSAPGKSARVFVILGTPAKAALARLRPTSGAAPWTRLLFRPYLVREGVVAVALASLILGPSLAFDLRLIEDPASADLAETDRFQYVAGWPSGYGFAEAVELVRERAARLGGEVIVLSDHFHGLPCDGLALYLSRVPRIHFYVDGHIPWGGKGLIEAWRPHGVPLLIVGNDGRDDLDLFERQLPEARRLAVFRNPNGPTSFRVYELDLSSP